MGREIADKTKKFSSDGKSPPIEIEFVKAIGRVQIKFNHTVRKCDLMFSHDLSRILGFTANTVILCPPLKPKKRKYSELLAPHHATLAGGNTELFVYCSAVKPQFVANKMVNLLAILPWRPRSDMLHPTQNISLHNPIWRPLIEEDFSDIDFYITDSNGRPFHMYGANAIFTCMTRLESKASKGLMRM